VTAPGGLRFFDHRGSADMSAVVHHLNRRTASLAEASSHVKEGRRRVGLGLHAVGSFLDNSRRVMPTDRGRLEAIWHLLRWLDEDCRAAMERIAERLDDAAGSDDGGAP
jgi:hypothetical protein